MSYSDHSCRFDNLETFDLLAMVDDYRKWFIEEVVGIRNTQGWVEVCVQYPGYPLPLWLDISTKMGQWKKLRPFQRFMEQADRSARQILTGAVQNSQYCRAGHVCDYPTYSEDPNNFRKWAPSALVGAWSELEAHKTRYAEAKAMSHFWGGKKLAQLGRITKKIELDAVDHKALAAAATVAAKEVAEGQHRKRRNSQPSRCVQRRSSAWVERAPRVVDETQPEIDETQLLGAQVSAFFNHYGWLKGTITAAHGLRCQITYDDESTEAVTFPDDTIQILRDSGTVGHACRHAAGQGTSGSHFPLPPQSLLSTEPPPPFVFPKIYQFAA